MNVDELLGPPPGNPIAHEGNPKESPPLTIEGGNLLTTATLDIALPFVEPPVIVPVDTPP